MGYNASSQKVHFRIYRSRVKTAFRALQRHASKQEATAYTDWKDVASQLDLRAALDKLRWEAVYEESGDLVIQYFTGEYSHGEEHVAFGVLAPYVEPGSMIEMAGEDGYRWRYRFIEDDGVTRMVEEEIASVWVLRERKSR
jgi:hypothetical protein